MMQQTMSVKEAADMFKVKPRTVREWIKHGKVPAVRIGRFYIVTITPSGLMLKHTVRTTSVVDRRRQAATFRALLRSEGKLDKEAFLRDRQAELEFERGRGG